MNMTPELIDRMALLIRSNADDLRAKGLTVAVHNDYRLNDESFTFWLFTYDLRGIIHAFKGEGKTYAEALDRVRASFAEATDDHHHAPLCPANHFHGGRAPTGQCNCGAVEAGVKMENYPAKLSL